MKLNATKNSTGGNDYVVTLNNTLNLTNGGSVTIGGTVVNNDGLKITNGPNITTSGIDAGNKKITNVENGTISDSSKDAVNGSQLYATNQNVTNISNQVAKGWNLTTSGNTTGTPTVEKVAMGDTVTIDGGKNINITQTGKKISIATSMTPNFTTVTTGNTTISNDGVSITGGTNGTVSITKDGLNNSNNTIKNVAPGVNGTDAVNKNQLDAVNKTASAGWNLTINEGKNSTNVAPNATVDLANKDGNIVITKEKNNVTFALNNKLTIGGKDGQNGKIGLDGANGTIGLNGKDGASANITVQNGKPGINGKDGENLTRIVYTDPKGVTHEVATLDDGLKFAGNKGDTIAKKLGETLSVVGALANESLASAKNIRVDSEDGKLVVKIAESPNFTSVVTGNTTTNNDGVTITGGANGTVSITKDGINAGNNKITNVTNGTLSADSKDAVNGSQLYATNQNVTNITNEVAKGWNLTTSGNTNNPTKVEKIAMGDTVTIDGGSNINITQDGKKITIATSMTPTFTTVTTGNTTINTDGMTITGGKENVTITKDGLNNGNNTITNVAPGVNGTDAVNKNQLDKVNSTASAGWNLTVNAKDSSNVAPNATVDLANKDGNIIITKEKNNVTFALNDKLTIGGKDGKIGLDGTNGTIGLNGKDGASANITVQNGKPGINGKDGENLTRIVYTDPKGVTHEVATLDDGLKFAGNKGDIIAKKLGETLSVVGELANTSLASAKNIRVDSENGKLVVKIAESPNFTSVVTGNTTTNNDGVTITGGANGTVSLTDKGLNNGNNTITNVANGTISADSKEAVNGSQLYATNQNVTNITNEVAKGWNLTTSGNTNNPTKVEKIAMGDTVTIDGGSNINITQDGKKITIATSMTPTFTTVTTGNTTINTDGMTITGGKNNTVSITKDGLNNGNNTITNVAPGVNGTDAVNKNQLDKVNSTASAGWNLTVNATDSSNVAPNATVDLANKDGNIIITKDKNNVTFALNDKLTIGGKDGQNGKIGLDGANGTIGLTGPKGADGKNGASANITVKDGKPGIDGKDGDTLTRIVYTDSNGKTHEVATLEDGLKFAGNQGNTIAKKLGETLDVVGKLDNASAASAKNIRVDSEDGKLVVKISENPNFTSVVTGNTTTNNNGVTITGGTNGTVTLTDKGLNNGNNTITNVANGTISADSKEAVNGSQLYATNQNVTNIKNEVAKGWNLTTSGNATNTTLAQVSMGDTVTIDGGSNINITQNGKTISIATSMKPNFTTVTTGNTTINTDGMTITGGNKDTVSITKDGLNNGNNTITNVAPGVNGTDAVNKDQLEKVNSTASAGWNLTINSGQNSSNIAPNATVDLANKDGNIVITKDANNVTFALNSNLTIGGKDGKDGKIGLDGANGTIGLTGPKGADGKDGASASISVKDGSKGIDGNDGKNGESKTRIIYKKPDGTTEEIATLNDGLYFTGDNTSSVIAKKLNETLTIKGNLAETAAVTDKNLRVDNVDGSLVVKMAKSLVDLTNATFTDSTGKLTTVISGNGTTISGGANGTVSLTDKGLNNGNNTITNVAPGVNGTDAVNKDQLEKVNSTASAGWNLTINSGQNGSNIAPNATVDLANKDGNIVITKDANNVTFALNSNLTIGGKDGKDGQIGISGKDGKDGVVINGNGTIGINGKDGVNGKPGSNATLTVVEGTPGINGKDGETLTRIVYTDSNGTTHEVATLDDGLKFAGNKGETIAKKLGETLTVVGALANETAASANNIRVDSEGGKLVVKIAENPNFTSVVTGNTTTNTNGVTITGGANGTVSLTDKGLNNGNNTITNVAPGVNGTDAVNKDQLEKVNSTASAGWNLTVNGTNSSNVAPNATVDLANKDGNIVITKDANNVTFALNSNLTIGGKDGKDGQIGISGKDGKDGVVINGNGTVIAGRDGVDGVDGQIGAKGKDGASVVLNGKDGSIGLTGPKGADGKDGASANISVKDGAKGLDGNDGKDGESKTRIVYEKPNGETETIATLNDGLYFTGDNTSSVIAKKLNETLTIKGNLTETAAVTDKNLRVDNVGGALVVKMAKSLVDLTNATFTDSTGKTTVISGNGTTISGGANGTVSLTDKGLNNGNNTITNVAPGVNGTDAVNKDQLEAVNKTASAGWNLTVNGTNSSNVAPNATVDLANKDGNIVITKDANNVTFALNSNLTIGGKDGKDGQIGISGKDGKDGVVINGNGTVIAGRDGVDGVDGQIGAKGKDGASVVLNGKDGSIGLTGPKGADGKDGASANISVKDGAKGLDGNDGKDGESKTRIVYEKPNGETETIATLNDGLIFTGNNEVKNNHKLNSVVKLVGEGVDKAASEKFSSASGNINVKANGSDTLEVQLNKDVNLTKDGSVTIGDTVVNNDGVKVGDTSLTQDGLTIKDGPSITKDGINAGDKVITGVADGDISATSTEAVNGSQLYTVQEAAKAAKTEVKQGDNITVTETTGKNGQSIYTVSVNKDLDLTKDGSVTIGNTVVNNDGVKVGDTSLTQDGLTIKDGPSITKDGINAGNKVITGVADGDISATSTEAINGSQLYNVKNELTKNAFGLKDESGNAIVQDLGTTVSVVGDGNVKTNVITKGDGSKALEVSLGTDILVGKNGADGKDGSIGVTGKDGASVVLNGKDGSIGLTGPKGADGKNGASANISVKDGAKGLDGNDGKDGESKTRIVYEKPDGTTEEIATLNDGLIFTGNNEVKNNHKLNSVVKLVGEGVDKAASEKFSSASGNINVKANGSDTLEVQLNKDVNLTKDGSVTIGDTTVNNNGLTINGGPSITKDGGINAGDKKITNVAAGEVSSDSKDAVNGSQLYATNQNVTNITNEVAKGWYVTTSGNTETSNVKSNVKMGDTVAIDGGKNIKVKQSGNTVSVATVDNPSFNSVTIGGDNGVNISSTVANDGVKELSVGSTDAPTRVTNVAAGVKNTDAVNVGQLKGVVNHIDNKVNNMNKDLKAGIAGAMAAGNLYHATIPGKSMVAAGVGTYKGQSALSVGYSRLSDNGKTGVKVSFNTDTRGGVGAAASVGYQW
ncbi:YadA-like family protein [Glaesserella sp. 15-184]|nr:YadA-like family protein [Glaesserella sp. 15-184]